MSIWDAIQKFVLSQWLIIVRRELVPRVPTPSVSDRTPAFPIGARRPHSPSLKPCKDGAILPAVSLLEANHCSWYTRSTGVDAM